MHPYFCFRAGTGSSKGFTCGTDTDSQQFDLPNELFHRLNHWNGKIHQALSKDGIFPSSCSFLSEISRGYGQGYELLLKIIRAGHPSYNEYASTLLGNRPTQSPADSLESYLDNYLDWLQLRAYLENNPNNLNHPSELDNFLHGLQHGLEYLRLTHEERRSSDPIVQQKYSQGQIVGTLASKEILVDKRRAYSHSATSSRRAPASSSNSSRLRPKQHVQDGVQRLASSRSRRVSSGGAKSVNEIEATPIRQVEVERFLESPLALITFPPDCSPQEMIYGASASIAL